LTVGQYVTDEVEISSRPFDENLSEKFVRMQELVKKYSEFISFPIYLWASKEVDVEVPVEETEEKEEKEEKDDTESEEEESTGKLLRIQH
jgi:HSP90 family molecular chaperone